METITVKLEVEGMRHAILTHLRAYGEKQHAEIEAAVIAACSPENIEAVISEAAAKAIRAQVEVEVKSFFSYGKGSKAVSDAVQKALGKITE